jgi:hypothetical protein
MRGIPVLPGGFDFSQYPGCFLRPSENYMIPRSPTWRDQLRRRLTMPPNHNVPLFPLHLANDPNALRLEFGDGDVHFLTMV